jgi:predicted 5'-methylthioadenosine/S-adenosylhomocysteine nucleosidase
VDVLVVAATERELGGRPGVACGIGPVEAAARTASALAERRPDAVLHVGLAGARSLEPPALVLGSAAVYEDLAAAIPVVSRAEPDPGLLARAQAALPEAHLRAIGTSARVGATAACDVEGMEGFAVLRACSLAGVPALELRAISNALGEPDRTRWRLEDANAALADATGRILAVLE